MRCHRSWNDLCGPPRFGNRGKTGGMLIHGAIIAREYGIPCVTGVAEAASLIQTGDTVTVDGFLGIVIIGEATLN